MTTNDGDSIIDEMMQSDMYHASERDEHLERRALLEVGLFCCETIYIYIYIYGNTFFLLLLLSLLLLLLLLLCTWCWSVSFISEILLLLIFRFDRVNQARLKDTQEELARLTELNKKVGGMFVLFACVCCLFFIYLFFLISNRL